MTPHVPESSAPASHRTHVRPIHGHVRYWLAWVPGLYAAAVPSVYAVAAAQGAVYRSSYYPWVAAFTALVCAAVLVLLLLARAVAEGDPRILKSALRTLGGSLLVSLIVVFSMLGLTTRVFENGTVAGASLVIFSSAILAQLLEFLLISDLAALPAPAGRPCPALRPSLVLMALVGGAFVVFLMLAAPRLRP